MPSLAAIGGMIENIHAWCRRVRAVLDSPSDPAHVEDLLEECRGLVVDCPEARELQELAWTQRASQELQSGTLGLSEARALMQEAEAIPVSKGSAEFVELHRRLDLTESWIARADEALETGAFISQSIELVKEARLLEILPPDLCALERVIASVQILHTSAGELLSGGAQSAPRQEAAALLHELQIIPVKSVNEAKLAAEVHQAEVISLPVLARMIPASLPSGGWKLAAKGSIGMAIGRFGISALASCSSPEVRPKSGSGGLCR